MARASWSTLSTSRSRRSARQLAPGPVPPVKRQVDGTEEVSEPFGPRPVIGHVTRVPDGRSIVNPDGSAQ
jgi:hypothetical protein